MAIQEASGSTLAVSAVLAATYDTVGFAALTFAVIGEITDLPAVGSVNNTVTHNPVGEIDVAKKAGSRNHGAATYPMALDASDAGQVIALANIRGECSFELTLPDGAIHYFNAIIMGFPTQVGGSDSMVGANLMVELTGAEVRVAA